MKSESILSLFRPPEDYRGDFGYVCGFTAHADILHRMTSIFTQGHRQRRIALAIYLHPPENHFPVTPGLHLLYRKHQLKCGLLHAKVALLRFTRGSDTVLRLVVSTGNWTHETLTSNIDLFWSVNWDSTKPDKQAASDILAAAEMFDWLKPQFDTSIIEIAADGDPPTKALDADLARIALARRRPAPRFFSNIEKPLLDEIMQRVERLEPVRRNQLIMGSGFFESGTSGLLADIVQRLREIKALTKSSHNEVILNTLNCQGIADQSKELQASKDQWTFRAPEPDKSQVNLHAKFIFSAGGSHTCTNAWCYIGSGNLSQKGLARAANASNNLEAGVLFEPKSLIREGKHPGTLGYHLPVTGAKVEPASLKHGEDFEHPGAGVDAPEIPYLVWFEGKLHLPETVSAELALTILDADGQEQTLPYAWDPAPAAVTLAVSKAEIPVLAKGDGFIIPPRAPMRIEDLLAGLTHFPDQAPEYPDDDDPSDDDANPNDGARIGFRQTGDYATRRIMRLMVSLCDRQPTIPRDEFRRWTNRCEEQLKSLLPLEDALINQIRGFGINPLTALAEYRFMPEWSEPNDPLVSNHAEMVSRVSTAWGLDALPSLFVSA
ncbi:hypothetical protein SKA58_16933 [Sphingomonas sp. SKA58]|uniref:hypothetical protein n=1 Tax=Sphingomonas sp. (strain SKA58) TaxID=314266 RepID=UPI0000D7B46B|nr:hypothetical protein [Sphingomonas sp. SKA58]EAT08883.1 hypothetical protein SKA58_16933 [Sphingomonas sp. SKA58]